MKYLLFVYSILCMSTCLLARSEVAQEIYIPSSFSAAMVSNPNDIRVYKGFLKKTHHTELLKLIVKQYYDFLDSGEFRKCKKLTIPKIIHQIWIGPHAFPEEAREWQKTWLALHPDWEYKLWTNEDAQNLEYENKKYFDVAQNWGEKADILRYEILYRFGGVYVDVDFEGLMPLDWLHYACDFYTGIHAIPLLFKNRLRINNGLIAARPHHPILAYLIDQIQHTTTKKGVAQRTGPDFFTDAIGEILPSSLAAGSVDMVFPSNFFYPSGPMTEKYGYAIKSGQAYVQPETLAVHHYAAYWIRPPQQENGVQEPVLDVLVHNYDLLKEFKLEAPALDASILIEDVKEELVLQATVLENKQKSTCQRPSGNSERMAKRYLEYKENKKT